MKSTNNSDNAQTNGKLIQQIIAGDIKAEEHLCKKYQHKILFYVRRKIGDIEDTKDICQDILIAALTATRKTKIKDPEKFSSFVYSICQNKVNDWLKQTYQKLKIKLSEVAEQLIDPGQNALTGLINKETKKAIDKSIRSLDARERRILYLKYIREWSSADIGNRLGLKPETVRKIAERAIKKIRKMLF